MSTSCIGEPSSYPKIALFLETLTGPNDHAWRGHIHRLRRQVLWMFTIKHGDLQRTQSSRARCALDHNMVCASSIVLLLSPKSPTMRLYAKHGSGAPRRCIGMEFVRTYPVHIIVFVTSCAAAEYWTSMGVSFGASPGCICMWGVSTWS
jgi:hypothetical protein